VRDTHLREPKPHVAPFVGPGWPVAAAWLVGALIVQATLAHYLAIRNVEPSFVLAVVVWYAIRVDAGRAVIYGLVAGLGEDTLSGQTGAAWMISTSLSALLASRLSRGFFADSIPLVTGITALATLVRQLLFWVVMAIGGYPPGLGAMHLHEALAQMGLNVVVIVIAMVIVRRYDVTAG
jgi:rod shape-determining protein MreD